MKTMMIKQVDEKDPKVKILRAEEAKLSGLLRDLQTEHAAEDKATERYLASKKPNQLEAEADRLLTGVESSSPGPQEIQAIRRRIAVLDIAITKQRSQVDRLRGSISLQLCKLNHDRYVEIERRIAKAVEELAAANEEEARFFDALRAAGASSISLRPMRIQEIGVASDDHGRAAVHRREIAQFLPEAL